MDNKKQTQTITLPYDLIKYILNFIKTTNVWLMPMPNMRLIDLSKLYKIQIPIIQVPHPKCNYYITQICFHITKIKKILKLEYYQFPKTYKSYGYMLLSIFKNNRCIFMVKCEENTSWYQVHIEDD